MYATKYALYCCYYWLFDMLALLLLVLLLLCSSSWVDYATDGLIKIHSLSTRHSQNTQRIASTESRREKGVSGKGRGQEDVSMNEFRLMFS